MKQTKEELLKKNEVLENRLKRYEAEDERIRTVFSELLDSFKYKTDFYGRGTEKEINVQSWEGIAFLMGELKADANYAMVLEARDNFREEAQRLQKELYELKNPKQV